MMPDLSLLEWLDAGTTPALVLLAWLIWRIERRLFKLELKVDALERELEVKGRTG